MKFFSQNQIKKIAVILISSWFVVYSLMQFSAPTISDPIATGEFKGPMEVKRIFERACYDCHSNETKLQWFDKIAPFSYMVSADIHEARKRYNFSTWDTIAPADQEVKLWYMVNMIEAGKMPLPKYALLHPKAKVTEKELLILKSYVTGLSTRNHSPGDTMKIKVAKVSFQERKKINHNMVPTSINGISYFEDYKNWKVIASTNRIDNGTMRLVYGNDITVDAIRANRINPWPDGAIIVKVVWNVQPEDKDGNVSPGNFNNIQVMVKDHKKFSQTEGWGFARFSGLDLKPYGDHVSFATACIDCHRLVTNNGFVFDVPTQKTDLVIK
ncbi:heme-binding domain-containing protein [Dyadobacter sp. 3J3]|uniref:heme-binding domain-containing protein n=1 Tax=Dyadobacter sp. 3J3 TaxID=2606600 RepID=UPI001358C14D|nr:heme-binding domain-containing protein [Dyadobacter sp. 3J3]